VRKRTEAAAIGGFVVGAAVLCVAAALLWGSGRVFRETARFVCYFDGSVEGLEVGAPLKARGVTIGRVVRIQLHYRQRPTDDRVPVFVEIDLKRVIGLGAERPPGKTLDQMIARGLRARLEAQSLVTGLLFVNFEQVPGTPLRYSEINPEGGVPEIPTVPRPFDQLGESVTSIVTKLERADIAGMVQAIADAAASVGRLARGAKVPEALAQLTATLGDYDKLGRHLDGSLDPILGELRLAVAEARKAIEGLDGATGAASRMVAPEAPLSVRLNDALGDVSRAASAVRDLAEYLQRNPNALLVGKKR
jgi:paraquat-inducible protein B